MEILISIFTALCISWITYVNKLQNGESFDLTKMARTAIIGLIFGIYSYISGYRITMENWEVYVSTNAGIVAVADQIIKFGIKVVSKIKNKK